MAIFYTDFEGGNDNYSGDSFNLTLSGSNGVTNGTSLFSSTGASFTPDLTGRYIRILTKGFYYISAVPSSTTLTLSVIPPLGTALPTTGSSLSYYIGGRWKTYANASLGESKPLNRLDELRVMGSPEPTSLGDGTWVNNGKFVYLQDRVIEPVEYCETAFTSSNANVTCTTAGTGKQGNNYANFAIGAGFPGGKAAYKQLPTTLNLSAYAQISFWYSCTVLASNAFRLCLCSDTSGDVVEAFFDIPYTITQVCFHYH